MTKTLSHLREIGLPAYLRLSDLDRILTWPTWGYLRELIDLTRSHDAGLVAATAMFRCIEAHQGDLAEESYNDYGKKLLSFILELMDKQGRWDDYLQTWERIRRDSNFYITYSTRSLDHHGIRMKPFVLESTTDDLRVHFLWLSALRKELIEQEVRAGWAGGTLRDLYHRSNADLTPGEIERRIEWLFRKTLSWSTRTGRR